jgi:hypothetical protein
MDSIGECHASTTTAAYGGGCQRLIVAAPAAQLSLHRGVRGPLRPPGAARLALAEP